MAIGDSLTPIARSRANASAQASSSFRPRRGAATTPTAPRSPFPRQFPRRGEIYTVDFNPARGSEQAGRRPAVVVSNDTNNQHGSTVIVAAMTSQQVEERARLRINVRVRPGELALDGVVLGGQLMTIEKGRLETYRGELTQPQTHELRTALQVSLGLPTS